MKKMNKKGFTLIEMLVVIAIIAVLVAIIIPTVTSATDKAAAATNAANLRSVKAELTTAFLSNDSSKYIITEASGAYTIQLNAGVSLPTAKKCGDVTEGAKIGASIDSSKNVTVYFFVDGAGDAADTAYDIASFVAVADGKASKPAAATITSPAALANAS